MSDRHRLRDGFRVVPAVFDVAVARDARLVRLVAEVLGRDPVPFGATLFDKSSEANWLVVWHQDTALPLVERREVGGWGHWSTKGGVAYAHAPAHALSQIVALRVHLDASTADNGPLRSSKAATAASRRVLHFEYAASKVLENGLELRAA